MSQDNNYIHYLCSRRHFLNFQDFLDSSDSDMVCQNLSHQNPYY